MREAVSVRDRSYGFVPTVSQSRVNVARGSDGLEHRSDVMFVVSFLSR